MIRMSSRWSLGKFMTSTTTAAQRNGDIDAGGWSECDKDRSVSSDENPLPFVWMRIRRRNHLDIQLDVYSDGGHGANIAIPKLSRLREVQDSCRRAGVLECGIARLEVLGMRRITNWFSRLGVVWCQRFHIRRSDTIIVGTTYVCTRCFRSYAMPGVDPKGLPAGIWYWTTRASR